MAKNIGLVGGFVGRFGNAVGYTNRGRQLIRVYQPKVYNPNTKRQQLTRERFRILNNIAREAATAINIGYNRVLPGFTRQAFVGGNMNLRTFIDADSERINSTALQFSDGPLPAPTSGGVTVSGTQITVALSGDANVLGYDADGTPMYVGAIAIAYPQDVKLGDKGIAFKMGSVMGSAVSQVPSSVSIPDISEWSGTSVEVWVFWKQSAVPLNGIPVSQWPWRTPFNASPTRYAGVVDIV